MKTSTERCSQTCLTTLVSLIIASSVVAGDVEEASSELTGTDRVPAFTLIPAYPKIARRDRIEGEVQVCFEITRNGRTRRIAVRKSTNRVFEKPSRRAVRGSRYEPLPSNAKLSGVKACRTFRFSLEPVVVETQNQQS